MAPAAYARNVARRREQADRRPQLGRRGEPLLLGDQGAAVHVGARRGGGGGDAQAGPGRVRRVGRRRAVRAAARARSTCGRRKRATPPTTRCPRARGGWRAPRRRARVRVRWSRWRRSRCRSGLGTPIGFLRRSATTSLFTPWPEFGAVRMRREVSTRRDGLEHVAFRTALVAPTQSGRQVCSTMLDPEGPEEWAALRAHTRTRWSTRRGPRCRVRARPPVDVMLSPPSSRRRCRRRCRATARRLRRWRPSSRACCRTAWATRTRASSAGCTAPAARAACCRAGRRRAQRQLRRARARGDLRREAGAALGARADGLPRRLRRIAHNGHVDGDRRRAQGGARPAAGLRAQPQGPSRRRRSASSATPPPARTRA